jgi:hypothetical protein
VLKDRRHDYRLAQRNADFFSEVLERALLTSPEIHEAGSGLQNRRQDKRILVCELFNQETGPFYFCLSVAKPEGDLDQADLAFIRKVFANIIALDDAARAIPSNYDENEELFEICVDAAAGSVVLDYSSTLWNTEWGVYFCLAEGGGFECLGIPDWKSPGKFIR